MRWHYQWIVVHQFLEATLDTAVYNEVRKNGPTLLPKTSTPKMPREFQVAAYRFGHSQIRPGYKINSGFGAPIFDARLDPLEADPNDLRGGRRGSRRFVEWDVFFDFGTIEVVPSEDGKAAEVRAKVKKNKEIDDQISTPMLTLPVATGTIQPGDPFDSLAGRNLLRHILHGIASGQDIAGYLKYEKIDEADFPKAVKDLGFHKQTPLWYYILLEAAVHPHTKDKSQRKQRLGQVGSRIVAEVLIWLLLSDNDSYYSHVANGGKWEPHLGAVPGVFTMQDLLRFARVA